MLILVSLAYLEQWLSFGIYLVMEVMFVLTVFKRHSKTLRKWLYYCYLGFSICFAVTYAITIFVVAFTNLSDDIFKRACLNTKKLYPEKYQNLTDCMGYIHNIAIASMTVAFLVIVPFRFAIARILKYGWLEQEHYEDN